MPNQQTEQDVDKKNKSRQVEPGTASGLDQTSLETPALPVLDLANRHRQADTLQNSHLPLLQRQMLAGQMDQQHGNMHLQRLLKPNSPPDIQRNWLSDAADWVGDQVTDAADWVGDAVGDITDTRPDEARLDAEEELADFMSEEYDLENHHPDTGRGLFDAHYNPATGNLTITSKICFNFENGDPTDPDWVAKIGGPAAAAAYAPEQFQWQPDEIAAWKTEAISMVQSVWSEQYTFSTTKPYWDALPPVHVHVEVIEAPAEGDDMAHYVVSIQKWPDDAGLQEGIVPPGEDDEQSTGHLEESANDGIENPDVSHFVRGTGTRAAYGIVATKNPNQVFFDQGSAEVRAGDATRLQEFGDTLGQPEIPPFPVRVTGHASSEGSDEFNQNLSEERATTVSNEIVSAGAKTQPTVEGEGETGADETPAWRRADINVENFVSDQTTVLHEFGHIFGLGDEYPTPDPTATRPENPRPPGTEVAHSELAQELIPGQEPIVAHHNENIMSNGEVIQPYHYVTFLEALGIMTNTTGDWDVGPGGPSGPGDFPIPDLDGPRPA